MAKFNRKRKEIDGEQFRATANPETWPDGCQVNAGSVTGFSYGTLAVNGDNKDGFEIEDLDWICTGPDGTTVYRENNADFINDYEVA